MATHSSVLAWRIPGTVEPGGLLFVGSHSQTQLKRLSSSSSDGLVNESCLTLATPWTLARQAPLCMGFSRQEYWSGLSCSSPEDLPDPGIKPRSPTLQADSWLSEPPGKSMCCNILKSLKDAYREYFLTKENVHHFGKSLIFQPGAVLHMLPHTWRYSAMSGDIFGCPS